MKNFAFLFWAYNVVWVGLIAYVVWLVVRLRKVSDRLDRIERRLDRDTG